jgi:hypothetical protein
LTVRITPRDAPQRTDLYGGIVRVVSDGRQLSLLRRVGGIEDAIGIALPLPTVAEIALDDDPGDLW